MKRTFSGYSIQAAALVVGLLITPTVLVQSTQAQPQTVRIMPPGNSITRDGAEVDRATAALTYLVAFLFEEGAAPEIGCE